MKLKDIIGYLNALDDCVLSVIDIKTGKEYDNWKGTILTIPWIFMDYCLYNASDYEAIGVNHEDGKTFFDITLYEPKIEKKKEIQF